MYNYLLINDPLGRMELLIEVRKRGFTYYPAQKDAVFFKIAAE